MTTQTPKQQAVFPDLPRGMKIADKDGNMTSEYYLFLANLILALQTNFTPEGIVVPPQTATNIALLTSVLSGGNILYDSTNDEFKGNVNGTWKTFTLT